MQIDFLTQLSIPEVNTAFNRAFEHYFLPVQSSPDELRERMQRDDLKLEWSTGAFENGELLGFMLHGVRETSGYRMLYNGGTGVVMEARGKRLTRKQYDWLLPRAKAAGFQRMQLEVIRENAPAVHIYKQVGFTISRQLDSFAGHIQHFPDPEGVQILEEKATIWRSEPGWEDYSPSWQHADESIRNLYPKMICFEARIDGERAGYLISMPNGRVMQYAVDPQHRGRGIGRALFSRLYQKVGRMVNVINVQRMHRQLDGFFLDLGLKPTFYQYEMTAPLD